MLGPNLGMVYMFSTHVSWALKWLLEVILAVPGVSDSAWGFRSFFC